jgi:D-sedoheptulose 7-phosphate isomerase
MSVEPTGFLYPFIEAEEREADALLADLAASARQKVDDSRALSAATLAGCADVLDEAARAMAVSFRAGGRLYAFGNGGSATDAEAAAARFRTVAHGRSLPALSLVEDRAVLTALANDIGFEVVFARQLAAHARPGDIALGLSTSGGSTNVLAAFAEGARRGLVTVGLCGYDGGAMAASGDVQHCMVVRSDSVHRIQEAQGALIEQLWTRVHEHVAEDDER